MINFFGPDSPATAEIEKSDTCRICGTVWPYGGLQSAYVNGREIGVMCAYRFGCEPGVRRSDNG